MSREYIVCDEHPDLHYRATRHYTNIADARKHARRGSIYRVSARGDDGTPISFTEVD